MKVTLLAGSPKEIAVAGALGCASAKPSAEILAELQGMENTDKNSRSYGLEIARYNQKVESTLKNSFGRGHGAVGDQAVFQFSISGVTRLSTLFLCQSPYASFLQQSLRRVQAGDYKLPDILASKKYAKDVVDRAFNLYTRMVEAGIPAEDARYILPLCTTTNIQMAIGARELCHLGVMTESENVSIETKHILDNIYTLCIESGENDLLKPYGPNYEPLSFYPAPDLFAEEGPVDNRWSKKDCYEIKNTNNIYMGIEEFKKAIVDRNPAYLSLLKHIHFTFIFGMSLACFHQAVRQRTWDHCVETLANAISNRDRIVIPPTIQNSEFRNDFINLHLDMLCCCRRAAYDEGIPKSEAFNIIPHSLKIYDLVHINGWNAIHSLGKRTCSKAQWEIRGIADKTTQIIKDQYPELGKYVGAQCMTYGYCPENKPCGKFMKEKEELK